jgi:hypothetical protein
MLEIPLAEITRVSHDEWRAQKDRITIATAGDEYLFSDGWKDLGEPLRKALTEHHGRRVTENSPDDWSVEPA